MLVKKLRGDAAMSSELKTRSNKARRGEGCERAARNMAKWMARGGDAECDADGIARARAGGEMRRDNSRGGACRPCDTGGGGSGVCEEGRRGGTRGASR